MEKDKDNERPGPSQHRKRQGPEPDSDIPIKQPKKLNGCSIHHDSVNDDENLVVPKDYHSWSTLLNAAKIRQYTPILEIEDSLDEGEIPDIKYHRDCRSLFTMKRDLQTLSKMPIETIKNSPCKFRSSRRASLTGPSRVYENVCVFCQRKTRYKRFSRTKEELTMCIELRGDESVRLAAIKKNDKRILALSSRELVAAEAHYHFSCYRDYTRCLYESIAVRPNTDISSNPEMSYDNCESQAYKMLFDYIRKDMFSHPRVITMLSLKDKLISTMNSLGESDIKMSTKKHLRRKVEQEFGKALEIFPDENGKLLLVPDNLTVRSLAVRNHSLEKELDRKKCIDTSNMSELVQKAAHAIRTDIKKSEQVQNWPPSIEDLDLFQITSPLTKCFLTTVLTGDAGPNDITDKVQRLINSFGQDLIYAVSNGKIKTPIHILLPYAVKSLTGNSELIGILNRLGHGVSYSQVEEIDTALCLKKLSRAEVDGVALPSNIKPFIQTTLAWDNIDRLEETLTGEGTSHRVNGIAVQAKVYGPEQQSTPINVERNKQRTIDVVVEELPLYNSGERVGPSKIVTKDIEYLGITRQAWLKNLAWFIARYMHRQSQSISAWTGFNIMCRKQNIVLQDSIGYLPTINFPATDMSTVFEVLNRSLTIMRSLNLTSIVCVFDQALYSKAAEIIWKHKDRFSGIVLRMGTFHTICTLLGVIGKRFQDAGLKDLCVEAGVVAPGSVAGVMEGRKYNRAVRAHKVCYEALMRLIWKEFLTWIEADREEALQNVTKALDCVGNLHEEIDDDKFNSVLADGSYVKAAGLFSEFLQHLRNTNGSLSSLWMSYIDMIELLLNMIRASREGNWQLHLSSIRSFIPWCFAYDRLNYARYLPIYYSEMVNLEDNNPDIHNYLSSGGFCVQLGPHNPFGKIPVDQTIEETVNKDTQTAGGTKGFSLKAGAVSRYYITAEYRSTFLRYLRQMLSLDESGVSHSDLTRPRIQKDENDVAAVVDLLETNWVNPFSSQKLDIVSLSTAAMASKDIVQGLMNAYKVGEKQYNNFKTQRLEVSPPLIKFHDRLPKQNLKTLSDIKKKKQIVKVSGKEVILRADKNLFGNLLIIAQGRRLNMQGVLTHPLGPVPWNLANPDGTLRKTNKAELKRTIEKNATPAESIEKPACCIIDGMAVVQKLVGDRKTFSEIADQALVSILSEGRECERIDVVFDVYRDVTIKQTERDKRAEDTGTHFKNIAPGHRIQQWRQFLSSSSNKTSLIKFLVQHWTEQKQRQKLKEKVMYVTCEDKCHKVTNEDVVNVDDLESTQEEADTRLLLHVAHAVKSDYKSVVIVSEDTDVFLLCLAYEHSMQTQLFLKCGTKTRVRYIDISALAQTLGRDVCQALLGMHAFTGCDTVSAFYGKGKTKALKILKSNNIYQDVFKELGKEWYITEYLFNLLQAFTCELYDQIKSGVKTVNELRYKLFLAKRGEADSSQLPPCKDCLIKHADRANYQSGIWRRCLEKDPKVPSPTNHGWLINESNVLSVEWMKGQAAPDDVIELLSCKCARNCKLPECMCLRNGLKCTYMCKLQACTNQAPVEDVPEYIDFEEEEVDSDISDDEDRDSV